VPSAPQEAPTPDGDEVAEPLPQVEVELKSPAPATTIPGAVRRPQKGKNITVRVKDRGPDPDKEAARVADKKARDRTLSTVPPRASGPSTPNTVPPTSLPQIAAPTNAAQSAAAPPVAQVLSPGNAEVLADAPLGYWKLDESGGPYALNYGQQIFGLRGAYYNNVVPFEGGPLFRTRRITTFPVAHVTGSTYSRTHWWSTR
jgi:hypothetical protein